LLVLKSGIKWSSGNSKVDELKKFVGIERDKEVKDEEVNP